MNVLSHTVGYVYHWRAVDIIVPKQGVNAVGSRATRLWCGIDQLRLCLHENITFYGVIILMWANYTQTDAYEDSGSNKAFPAGGPNSYI
jgi:hypothetical protein